MPSIDDVENAARQMAGFDISHYWTVAYAEIRDVRHDSHTATLAMVIRPKNQEPGVHERLVAERLDFARIETILKGFPAIVDFLGDVLHAEKPLHRSERKT